MISTTNYITSCRDGGRPCLGLSHQGDGHEEAQAGVTNGPNTRFQALTITLSAAVKASGSFGGSRAAIAQAMGCGGGSITGSSLFPSDEIFTRR